MLIGFRKNRQDGFSRIIVSKTLKYILYLMFHVNIKDANTPFRLININKLKRIIRFIPNNYHLSNIIQSVLFAKFKFKVNYVNITFKPRQGGVNSINFNKIFKIGVNSLKEFYAINKNINIELKKYEKKN